MPDIPRRPIHSMLVSAAEECQSAGWRPPADIYRTRRGWLVKLDLAGVRPDEIQVSARGRCLLVSGVRRDWTLEEGQRYYSLEISYNRFERAIELPAPIDQARITADYRDGMFLVHLVLETAEP